MGKYDDMIYMPRPKSKNHMPMSLPDRAAQFSPFAALTGHEGAIKETARITEEKKILTEQEQIIIDQTLQDIKAHLSEKRFVRIKYFVKDSYKMGGNYQELTAYVHTIKEKKKLKSGELIVELILDTGIHIPVEDILEIEQIQLEE